MLPTIASVRTRNMKRKFNGTKTPEAERDIYQTPDKIMRWIQTFYNIDVDLAASDTNHKAAKYITETEDSLTKDWTTYGDVGFLNPPYSNIDPFVLKAIEEAKWGFITIMLIPTLNGEARDEWLLDHGKITNIVGRIAFVDAHGNKKTGNNRGSMIVVFGDKNCRLPKYIKRELM